MPSVLQKTQGPRSVRRQLHLFLLSLMLVSGFTLSAEAQEANWIWSPEHPRGQAAAGDCYFRKTMQLSRIEKATITLTADDAYDLYINGQRIGKGNSINQLEQYDITRFLVQGRNVVAVKVQNVAPGPAALAARVFVKPYRQQWLGYSTDNSWRTSIDYLAGWELAAYNDSRWKAAQVYGVLGETAPWDRREEADPQRVSENQRFRIDREFAVDQILGDEETGSLVNIAFNEFGHIIAAQEGGPLLLIYDSDKDGIVDKVREYCDLVKGIQGILALNGDVYVTGDGPEGPGVYRLIDEDRNGALEEAVKLVGFTQGSGEHGAHGLALGPDGKIYCVLGNHTQYKGRFAETSPLKHYYEGDLIQPKYEDPGGHAAGVKAPGGTVIRFDVEGEKVELVASGLRNAFDLTFRNDGRLYVHDSDMESDEGSVWYRPTSLLEIVDGGEYGWRSGWSKWPNYYYDRMPNLLETGRGSPTGCCVYEHHMFPIRYHDNLFLADWTKGQIISVRFDENGRPQSEVVIEGQPLNVTDVAVGPDGWLYFCTGGRGTKGGIYQVRWLGDVPESIRDLGDGIASAIKQPQLDAAWSRQKIATLKRQLGSAWGDTVAGVAFSDENPSKYRLRALDLMQLFGPAPTTELLVALCETPNEAVRARAATLLGRQAKETAAVVQLQKMLADKAPEVQLAAAKSLQRAQIGPKVSALKPMLASLDREVAWTARRLLELVPTKRWSETLLEDEDQRVQLQAALALITVEPSKENADQVLTMGRIMLEDFVSDRNFIDLLRLFQVTLHRTNLKPSDVPELREQLANEYPVGEPILNRELFRLLAYLKVNEVVPKAITYLQSDAPMEERLHVAMHLKFFDHQWTAAERLTVMKFFEETLTEEAGSSVPLYVMGVTKDIAKDLPLAEARIFVSEGAKWPNAALVSLYRYPEKLSESDLNSLIQLDQQIDRPGFESEEFNRLRTGIVALLSQHGDERAQAYLREIWIRSPARRQVVALGLSTYPTDENWDYLVRSLPVLETYAVPAILSTLTQIEAATNDSQALREVVLHGLRLERDGQSAAPAVRLLQYWTGQEFSSDADAGMSDWQAWYAKAFPNQPEATLPELEANSPWNVPTLEEFFGTSEGRRGDLDKGRFVYEKAECKKCHTYDGSGTRIGPDLTNLASRFTRKEALESILYPSHIISDQYRTQRVLTTDGKVITGVVTENADGTLTVRDSQLQMHIVAEQDVDTIVPSKQSLMPSGLIDSLTSTEIRDLMTFMGYGPSQQQVADRASEIQR